MRLVNVLEGFPDVASETEIAIVANFRRQFSQENTLKYNDYCPSSMIFLFSKCEGLNVIIPYYITHISQGDTSTHPSK